MQAGEKRTCEDDNLATRQHKGIGCLVIHHSDGPFEIWNVLLIAPTVLLLHRINDPLCYLAHQLRLGCILGQYTACLLVLPNLRHMMDSISSRRSCMVKIS